MARFCDKCGAQVGEKSTFCSACGARVVSPTQPAVPFQDVQQPAPYPPPETYAQTYAQRQNYTPPAPVAAPARRSSGLKLLLIVLMVLGLGALGGIGSMLYLGNKVVKKIETKAAEAGLTTDAGKTGPTFMGDPCRFLTTAQVSKAIGVPILEMRIDGSSCEYLARGTAANMTSKHLSVIAGQRGADKATQEKLEKFARNLFETQQKNAEAAEPNGVTETAVLTISFDEGSTQSEMTLNSKVMGAFGQTADNSEVAGIGDEAFVAAGGMMLIRKGDTLVRFTYLSCPCTTKQIVPLAKEVVAAL
jgi:hypothetical protein